MKYYLISFLFISCGLHLKAQSLQEAYTFFDRYEYAQSAKAFENVLSQKRLKTEDLKCLTYSYYITGDYQKCNDLIDSLISDENLEPVFLWYKAESLKALGNYEEAKTTYQKYQQKNPEAYTAIEIASCDYLSGLEVKHEFIVKEKEDNLKKADNRYFEPRIGWIEFHECGLDSMRGRLQANDANDAELMLMRPFVMQNGTWKGIELPKELDDFAISSFSINRNNTVLFTAANHLAKKGADQVPHIYEGFYNEGNASIEQVKLWQFSGFEDSTATAFAVFHPEMDFVVFAKNGKKTGNAADLYYTIKNGESWSTPLPMKNLNTPFDESYPMFVSADKLQFTSTGRPGYGKLDIFETKFNVKTQVTGDLDHLKAPFNSNGDDYWKLTHKDTSYLSSNRFGGTGDDDIWQITSTGMSEERKKAILDSLHEKHLNDILSAWIPPRIYFDFNKYNPNSDFSFISKLVSILNENPELHIEIVGNTDIRGGESYNEKLGEMRAQTIAEKLKENGISEQRMRVISEGDKYALQNSKVWSPESIHQQYRFVEITMYRK